MTSSWRLGCFNALCTDVAGFRADRRRPGSGARISDLGFNADPVIHGGSNALLVANESTNLYAQIPHGEGQTTLREALLIADHNAYHLRELVLVRRLPGAWK